MNNIDNLFPASLSCPMKIEITATLRIRIEQDEDSESPAEWGRIGEIAYLKSARTTLGTERVGTDRMDEISKGIRDGSLLGLPVYAYVHSGSTIATTPFSCQWDSGPSGFVYCTKEEAINEFGKKVLTAKCKIKALQYLAGEVETFDQYIKGEVYGYVVERVKLDADGGEISAVKLDSCWGHYGLKYCVEQAFEAVKCTINSDSVEAAEKLACEERDIVTVVYDLGETNEPCHG